MSLDVGRLDDDPKPKPFCELPAEPLVAFSRGPETVIEMCDAADAELAVFGKVAKQQRQGHRIGTARQADDHTRSRRALPVPADGAADFLMKRGQCVVPEGRLELPTPRL